MIDLLKPAIGVASLSSPLEVGAEKAPKTVVSLVKVLIQNGFQVESFGSIETADQARETGKQAAAKQIDAMVFAPVCWYEDYYVLDFMEECSVPFLIWPLPGMETGGLCRWNFSRRWGVRRKRTCHFSTCQESEQTWGRRTRGLHRGVGRV